MEQIIKNQTQKPLQFYVALQGDKSVKEYINIAQTAEKLGYDRIYVYDDLMYKPSWPILAIIGEHTNRIRIGPCLVNGFYSHPAILAENIAFLDELTGGRAVLGVGRGAFFDFLEIPNSEPITRKGCIETITLIKRFLAKDETEFKGEYFSANKNAVLRFNPLRKDIPFTLGSWNSNMAEVAGEYCDEFQTACVWNEKYLKKLLAHASAGYDKSNNQSPPVFSIGGMSCISRDQDRAYRTAKEILAVYLPYLSNLVKESGYDITSRSFQQLAHYSKAGEYEKAAEYINEELIRNFSLSGTPEQAIDHLYYLVKKMPIGGVLFSPPFGTYDSIEDNLKLIKNQVIAPLLLKLTNNNNRNHIPGASEKIKPVEITYNNTRISKEYDSIIIGAGLSGLSCCLSLIQQGKKVLLLEKTGKVGGCQSIYEREGFQFEPNLHSMAELGDTGIVNELLTSFGLMDEITYVKLDPAVQMIFPDRNVVIPANYENLLSYLKTTFPDQESGLETIFDIFENVYREMKNNQVNTPLMYRLKNKNFKDFLDQYLTNKEVKAIISGFWAWGFPPQNVSALTFAMLTYSLLGSGNYLPEYGIGHLFSLMQNKIVDSGGVILCNSPVKEITIKNGRTAGVVLENGTTFKSKTVISSTNVDQTFNKLIDKQHIPFYYQSKLKKIKPSLSAISVQLGIQADSSFLNTYAVNNMIYNEYDFHTQYEAILTGDVSQSPLCISIPTLVSPELAPEGHHIVSIFTPIPGDLKQAGQWKMIKENMENILIDRAEKIMPGLKSKIVIKETATPDTLYRYTGNTNGAFGGLDFSVQAESLRPDNRTPIPGLYLAGHWTYPGPGTHNALISGKITASLINKK